ncbi:MAG: tRNA uridine-5-carboxymethylaminomethyl(34) synthesis GTPase MnmE, partial [Kiritimatiellae bacterium]|nr:tRNA uridine-5-carboxymethylaminomethyl(34) synthesis GTPase MnmE [Kiritimatiellia bacterium]
MEEGRETIAAIATAAGAAGVSVVRVSGPEAFAVADRLLPPGTRPVSERRAGTFFHTRLFHPETGETVDDAVVLVFRAPHSYTGEDSVELQGHGGTVPARRLLDAVLAAGARLAG